MTSSVKESGAFDLAQWRARIKKEVLPSIASVPERIRMQRIALDPALTPVWKDLAASVVPNGRRFPGESLDVVAYHVVFPPDFSTPPTKKRINPVVDALRRFQQVAAKDTALAKWVPEVGDVSSKAKEALAVLVDSRRWTWQLAPSKPDGSNAKRNWIALHLRIDVMPALFKDPNYDAIARLINSAYPELTGASPMSADDVRKLKARKTGR